MSMTVGDLLAILGSVPNKDCEIIILQPRSWVKKQPDEARTKPVSVEIGQSFVRIKTHL